MEQLKKYVMDNLGGFDNRHDLEGKGFERALQEAIDTCLIYHSDCKAFFEINPSKVIELSKENGWECDPRADSLQTITDTAREAFVCLAYNHLYSELEQAYKEAQKLDKDEFLGADFEDNIELLQNHDIDNLYTNEEIKDLIKHEIDENNLFVALHILTEVNESEADYYIYDRSMGTLETPTPLKDNDDLLSYAQDMGLVGD